jgi:hypothetical protein
MHSCCNRCTIMHRFPYNVCSFSYNIDHSYHWRFIQYQEECFKRICTKLACVLLSRHAFARKLPLFCLFASRYILFYKIKLSLVALKLYKLMQEWMIQDRQGSFIIHFLLLFYPEITKEYLYLTIHSRITIISHKKKTWGKAGDLPPFHMEFPNSEEGFFFLDSSKSTFFCHEYATATFLSIMNYEGCHCQERRK